MPRFIGDNGALRKLKFGCWTQSNEGHRETVPCCEAIKAMHVELGLAEPRIDTWLQGNPRIGQLGLPGR